MTWTSPNASLKQKQLTYLSATLATGGLAPVLFSGASSYARGGMLAPCLVLMALLFLRGAQVTRRELWLRTHIAPLRLAKELLGLTEQHAIVRTYVECIVELYPWPIGLDVLIARELAKKEDGLAVPVPMTEAAAMQKLSHLPYENDIDT